MSRLLAIFAMVVTGGVILLAQRGQSFSRVDAGGPMLRMLMVGRGDFTVVFESGAGGPLETWTRIQPEVSRFARTISYDRAGNGLSEAGPTPRDGRRIAMELHTALHDAQAPPPYILVGHSLGGPYIRIFAGLYPEEVAGLVLVDPTQEELIAWAKARDPKPSKKHRPHDEVDCAPATFAQAREHPIPTHIPVVLLTGMGPRVIPGFLPQSVKAEVERDQKLHYPVKLQFHREWVEQFPGGQLVITENSGHGIPFEEPEAVIRAIREVVNRTRLPK